MLTSASKHAILIFQFLAKADSEHYHSVSEIAEVTKAPAAYLSKLVKELASLGILESKRGVKGGIRLSEKGKKASLFELCKAMKDPLVEQQCVLQNTPCNPKKPCAFHNEYRRTRENLLSFLKQSSALQL
jgi:Rrf2 family protein